MKIKLLIIGLILSSITIMSCRVKDSCELNHTGTITVTNNTSNDVEVLVDNTVIFTVLSGNSKSVVKPIGTYEVKCLDYPEEYIYSVEVFECETEEISVPE